RDLSRTTTDLSVSMSAPASGTSGTNATVTMTVKNNGPNQVSGATLRDMYTAGATFVSVTSSTGTCGSIPVVQCDLGDLANGATAAVTLVLQLTTPGSVTNTATISGNLPDSNLGDNTATATTNVTGAIYSLLPSLSSLSPQAQLAGAPNLTLTVNDSNFSSDSVVNWNNTSLPTTFVNPNQLTATVAASLMANPGFDDITVSNPSPGGGTSGSLPFTLGQSVALNANDIVFDPFTRKIYASVLAVMPGDPNVVATVGYSDGIQVWDVTNSGATSRPLTKGLVNDVYEGSVLAWGDSTNLYSNDEGLSPSSFHRFVVGSASFA